jgi:hypothetical protein
MGFFTMTTDDVDPNLSYMIVANHTSMADIMLMLALSKPLCFVGKQSWLRFLYLVFLQANLYFGGQELFKEQVRSI